MSTWQRMPTFDCEPVNGPVQLGNLLADPYKPQKRLTIIQADDRSRYPEISTVTEERTIDRNATNKANVSLVGKVVDAVDVTFKAAHSRDESLTLRMGKLTTTFYLDEPDRDLILERIRERKVKEVMRPTGFSMRQPVYMIVGLKVAKDFQGVVKSGKSISGETYVGGGMPGYVEASAGTGAERSTAREDTFKSGEDRVIAYMLLKIEEPRMSKAEVKVSDFRPNKDSLLSKKGDDSSDEEEEEVTDIVLNRSSDEGFSNAVEISMP